MERKNLYWTYADSDDITAKMLTDVQTVYTKMADDVSREIYTNRLMFSLTKDCQYIRNVVLTNSYGKYLYDQIQKHSNDSIFVYGAGTRGERLVKMFPEIKWKGFIDESQTGVLSDIPIIPMNDYQWSEQDYIVISPEKGHEMIETNLLSKGVPARAFLTMARLDQILFRKQYFDEDFIGKFQENMAFIDGGCYDGENSISFIKKCLDGDKARVFAFEPDSKNYKQCVQKLAAFPNAAVYHMLISDKEEMLLTSGEGTGVHLSTEGDEKVFSGRLDNIITEQVGFIKLDVEGAECAALRGAKRIISGDCIADGKRGIRPLIAVSMYHKRWDILKITSLILELNPEYQFYMRHYCTSFHETVLYAV